LSWGNLKLTKDCKEKICECKPLLQYSLSLKLERTMNQPIELSLEQQFSIRSFETQVQKMSREQAQDFLVKLYEQMMLRETMYKHFLKHEWGLEPGPQI
jgi:hypothetical protein